MWLLVGVGLGLADPPEEAELPGMDDCDRALRAEAGTAWPDLRHTLARQAAWAFFTPGSCVHSRPLKTYGFSIEEARRYGTKVTTTCQRRRLAALLDSTPGDVAVMLGVEFLVREDIELREFRTRLHSALEAAPDVQCSAEEQELSRCEIRSYADHWGVPEAEAVERLRAQRQTEGFWPRPAPQAPATCTLQETGLSAADVATLARLRWLPVAEAEAQVVEMVARGYGGWFRWELAGASRVLAIRAAIGEEDRNQLEPCQIAAAALRSGISQDEARTMLIEMLADPTREPEGGEEPVLYFQQLSEALGDRDPCRE